ncbi:MAG: trypsin-like serine protease, partial [Nannocystaceae bacterium]|nr:trypsin-like serine protease [Nannocystaceae bacterium]
GFGQQQDGGRLGIKHQGGVTAQLPLVPTLQPLALAALTYAFGLLFANEAGAVPDEPQKIVDGDLVPGCGWPNVVRLEDSTGRFVCTATLIHPSIIATAAHCLVPPASDPDAPVAEVVAFGDGVGASELVREIEFCEAQPDFDEFSNDNRDYGFCQLAEPVLDVPIIPLAYGCDHLNLDESNTATLVGFGQQQDGGRLGIKRATEVQGLQFRPSGEIELDSGACLGDSGGPAFTRASDGTWRQFGVSSYLLFPPGGPVCGEDTVSGWTAAWQVAVLVEESTDFDVTPCHDIDGNWEPSLDCRGVPLQSEAESKGGFLEACAEVELSGFLSSCGDPLAVDEDPPFVEVVTPADGTEFPDPGEATASVEFVVEADDGDGSGVAGVTLEIEPSEGELISEVRTDPPYTWTVELVRGNYRVRAFAVDNAELTTTTEWATISVGGEAGGSGGSGGSGETGDETMDSDGGDDSSGSSPTAEDGDADGCACGVRSTMPVSPWLMPLLWLWLRRRRMNGGARVPTSS